MTDADRLREMLQDLAIDPVHRLSHYNIDWYMEHRPDCPKGGDQCCPCGEASTYCNVDQLLDAAEAAHYVLKGMTLAEAYEQVRQRIRATHNTGEPPAAADR